MKFAAASLVDLPQLHLDWYRFAMEGGPKPEFLRKPVAYYVSGAERWRYADTLEAVTAESRPFFFDSGGAAARNVYAAGSLAPAREARGAPDSYRYDPRDLSLAKIESESNLDSALDQRGIPCKWCAARLCVRTVRAGPGTQRFFPFRSVDFDRSAGYGFCRHRRRDRYRRYGDAAERRFDASPLP